MHNNALSVYATNAVFSDPWYGVEKSLVVYYRFGKFRVVQKHVTEGKLLKIVFPGFNHLKPALVKLPGKVLVLRAVYGHKDVTKKVAHLVALHHFHIHAENSVFGDSWVGVKKTLSVVYLKKNGMFRKKVVKEHNVLTIHP